MRVVIALDSFKGSIGAAAACAALAQGWLAERPADEVLLRPMADGGEGTLDAVAAALPEARRMPVTVTGPAGRPVEASWLLLPDGTGVVELASTSGIELLAGELRPWDASTRGFGEAIAAALDDGARRLVLGIGSSASTDGGVGMLSALGMRFLGADGAPIPDGARGLPEIVRTDAGSLRLPPSGGVAVLTDVRNPLLGPTGAAAVYGPQKGVRDVARAEAGLARVAEQAPQIDPSTPGAGAAGGTGFALLAWGARLVPGADEVAALVGLDASIARASLVITGEGSFDPQSSAGKVPGFVREAAERAGIPAAIVAGRICGDADVSGFAAALSLSELAGSPAASLADPTRWLRAAGARLAAYRTQDR